MVLYFQLHRLLFPITFIILFFHLISFSLYFAFLWKISLGLYLTIQEGKACRLITSYLFEENLQGRKDE